MITYGSFNNPYLQSPVKNTDITSSLKKYQYGIDSQTNKRTLLNYGIKSGDSYGFVCKFNLDTAIADIAQTKKYYIWVFNDGLFSNYFRVSGANDSDYTQASFTDLWIRDDSRPLEDYELRVVPLTIGAGSGNDVTIGIDTNTVKFINKIRLL